MQKEEQREGRIRKERENEENDGRWSRGETEWKKKRGIGKDNEEGRTKGRETHKNTRKGTNEREQERNKEEARQWIGNINRKEKTRKNRKE